MQDATAARVFGAARLPAGRVAGPARLAVAGPAYGALVAAVVLMVAATAQAGWIEGGFTQRRGVEVEWPADRATGEDLAMVGFYTAGKHKPDGSDVRVALDDGKIVPSRVLRVGPGDSIRVTFLLTRNVRKYWIYWGNPTPPPPPKGTEDVPNRCGLLMEMRQLPDRVEIRDAASMQAAWQRAKPTIGFTLVERLFLGVNPFGEPRPSISRFTGRVFAPVNGTYTFAVSAQSRGSLIIDGKPLVFATGSVNDARFSAKIDLTRGAHGIEFYMATFEGDSRCTVAWQRPDQQRFEPIGPESFGIVRRGTVGAMETARKALTADFRVEYLGECFYAGHYSHRYRFTAYNAGAGTRIEWDLGEGQKASGPAVEHVYLSDGVYPVELSLKMPTLADTQTTRIAVSRLYETLDRPISDQIAEQAKIVGGYDFAELPPASMPWAVYLLTRAEKWDAAIKAGTALAGSTARLDYGPSLNALGELTDELVKGARVGQAVGIWAAVPGDSSLQPRAARAYGRVLLWRAGDFAAAARAMEPLHKKHRDDQSLARTFAHALVLSQRADEGSKILRDLPIQGPADRQAALSGAAARSIEYYIRTGEWESGEEAWERWQAQFPADFLEGYSVLLRTKLLEQTKLPTAAAKVAEAFALAVPNSSYAPQLLDHASRLLEKTDAEKSKSLRQLLKQKYPEDPLAN